MDQGCLLWQQTAVSVVLFVLECRQFERQRTAKDGICLEYSTNVLPVTYAADPDNNT